MQLRPGALTTIGEGVSGQMLEKFLEAEKHLGHVLRVVVEFC